MLLEMLIPSIKREYRQFAFAEITYWCLLVIKYSISNTWLQILHSSKLCTYLMKILFGSIKWKKKGKRSLYIVPLEFPEVLPLSLHIWWNREKSPIWMLMPSLKIKDLLSIQTLDSWNNYNSMNVIC